MGYPDGFALRHRLLCAKSCLCLGGLPFFLCMERLGTTNHSLSLWGGTVYGLGTSWGRSAWWLSDPRAPLARSGPSGGLGPEGALRCCDELCKAGDGVLAPQAEGLALSTCEGTCLGIPSWAPSMWPWVLLTWICRAAPACLVSDPQGLLLTPAGIPGPTPSPKDSTLWPGATRPQPSTQMDPAPAPSPRPTQRPHGRCNTHGSGETGETGVWGGRGQWPDRRTGWDITATPSRAVTRQV